MTDNVTKKLKKLDEILKRYARLYRSEVDENLDLSYDTELFEEAKRILPDIINQLKLLSTDGPEKE